jgi:hypothetical protein
LADWLDEDGAKAVAVLATATVRILGRDAPVVTSLQRLLRERSERSYDLACASFDALDATTRRRIAQSAPGVARRRLKQTSLPGLLGVLSRG